MKSVLGVVVLQMVMGSSGSHAVRLQSRNGYLITDGGLKVSEKGLFHILMEEWKEIPDKAGFVKNCTGIVAKLLPRLQDEYTARQVPKILMHECDNYATANDFKTINTTYNEGKRACKNSAGRLGAEFLGSKNYNSWCEYVFDLMSREGLADYYHDLHMDHLSDIRALKKQLRELQRQYDDALAAGAADGKKRRGRSAESLRHDDDEIDQLKKHWEKHKDLPCCPEGCKPCDEDGKALELPKELQEIRKDLKFLQRRIKTAQVATELKQQLDKNQGLFHMLVKEWKEIPDRKEFVNNCTGIVGDLMPKLRKEYTARQVPKIVFHECANYATKLDFKTVNTTLEEGQYTCEKCATRLGAEFLGNQNYEVWCDYVFGMLEHDILKDHYRDLQRGYLDEMASLRSQLDELKRKYEDAKNRRLADRYRDAIRDYWDSVKDLPCCPRACRPCFDELGEPIFGDGPSK